MRIETLPHDLQPGGCLRTRWTLEIAIFDDRHASIAWPEYVILGVDGYCEFGFICGNVHGGSRVGYHSRPPATIVPAMFGAAQSTSAPIVT